MANWKVAPTGEGMIPLLVSKTTFVNFMLLVGNGVPNNESLNLKYKIPCFEDLVAGLICNDKDEVSPFEEIFLFHSNWFKYM